MHEILFITGNQNKLREYQHIMGNDVQLSSQAIDLPEIQDSDVVVVARQKALDAFAILKKPLIVEDSGLELSAFPNHLPGAFMRWFLEMNGSQTILDILISQENRNAVARGAIGYCDEQGNVEVFVGETRGVITRELRGESGFGFDPIFIPDGKEQTYAEMGIEEKSKLSHRRRAIERFKASLL